MEKLECLALIIWVGLPGLGLLYVLARAIEPVINWIDGLGGPPWDEGPSWEQKKWDKEWEERH